MATGFRRDLRDGTRTRAYKFWSKDSAAATAQVYETTPVAELCRLSYVGVSGDDGTAGGGSLVILRHGDVASEAAMIGSDKIPGSHTYLYNLGSSWGQSAYTPATKFLPAWVPSSTVLVFPGDVIQVEVAAGGPGLKTRVTVVLEVVPGYQQAPAR